jgi:tetratricopeptide (TPR) repeat protein
LWHRFSAYSNYFSSTDRGNASVSDVPLRREYARYGSQPSRRVRSLLQAVFCLFTITFCALALSLHFCGGKSLATSLMPESQVLLDARKAARDGDYRRAQLLLKLKISDLRSAGRCDAFLEGCLSDLAALYGKTNQKHKAQAVLEELVDVEGKLYWAGHPYLSDSRSQLLEMYKSTGELSKAEQLYSEEFTAQADAIERQDPAVIGFLLGIAQFYESQKRVDEAASMYEQALQIAEKNLRPKRQELKFLRNRMGQFYYSCRKPKEALAAYAKLVESYKGYKPSSEGELDVMLLACLNLGRLYDGQLDYAHAEQAYLTGLEFARLHRAQDSWFQSLLAEELAEEYVTQRRQGEPKPLLQQAIAIRQARQAKGIFTNDNKTALDTDRHWLKQL